MTEKVEEKTPAESETIGQKLKKWVAPWGASIVQAARWIVDECKE